MGTEIYYFSGTGNSLHVARGLKKQIPESKLIPMVSLLNRDVAKTCEETVGFVFPIHGMTVPIPVKKFIKKLDLRSAGYIFGVATRGGTKHRAFTEIEKILRTKVKNFDSYFTLNMISNDPKLKTWHQVTEEEITELESELQNKLESIGKIIVNKEVNRKADTEGVTFQYITPVNFLLERLVPLAVFFAELEGLKDYFYSDSKCRGCGTCEKVCLSGKIKIVNNKPVWQSNVKCYMCYACLNYCPAQAVQIKSKWYMKSYTEKNERYPHPWATADDIARQKEDF